MMTNKRPTVGKSLVIDVVGTGVQGLLLAHELMDAGVSVRLWERNQVGREASWAGGGILSPLYPWRYSVAVTRLSVWSQAVYRQWIDRLSASTGVNCGWIESGLLVLGAPEPDALPWSTTHGVRARVVHEGDIGQIEPLVRASDDALWFPEIAQVRNPRLLKALKANIEARGARISEGVEVKGFTTERNKLRALCTSAGDIPSTVAVVAAGAWTGELLRGTGVSLPIEPVRGQMISFELPARSLRRIVLDSGFYLIPRSDGLVLAGSTLERTGFDGSTTDEARAELYAAACRIAPFLKGIPIARHWAGLRPGSPNDVPYIGAHPYVEGLYVNAGHYRNGIVMAPASARLMADLILDRTPTFDPTPYRLPKCS